MLLDNVTDDYDWYMTDQAGYEAESQRRYNESQQKLEEYMGPDFINEPLDTREELEEKCIRRAGRLNKLRELKAPDILIEHEQEVLAELIIAIKEGKFIVTKEEKEYRSAYEERYAEFIKSYQPTRRGPKGEDVS